MRFLPETHLDAFTHVFIPQPVPFMGNALW
ncbi:hypothetical protein BOV_A0167 [Brucella ovis ATCC 25840]|uniref:Uncharacterized protein n=1 Tax=Brucella ovis (strain ATCC 25840 / 63/290 / NCTC 10512) TaxID=444178 RepID=A0A0H3AQL4_BRUO2|nr:hypothetical protein BOV_A0167 [Brucella ovis ATCC 25840]